MDLVPRNRCWKKRCIHIRADHSGQAVVLALGLVMFCSGGCISFESRYRATEPLRESKTVGSEAQTVSRTISILHAPSSANPGRPLLLSVTETTSSPEYFERSYLERTYTRYWSPLLILLGIGNLPAYPLWLWDDGREERANSEAWRGHKEWGFPKPSTTVLWLILGVGGPFDSLRLLKEQTIVEPKQPSGKAVTRERPGSQIRIKSQATLARGFFDRRNSEEIVTTGPDGRARFYPSKAVTDIDQLSGEMTIELAVLDEPRAKETITLDAGTVEALRAGMKEAGIGRELAKAGKIRPALERTLKAYQILGDDPEGPIWKEIITLYSALDVKPAPSESARRSLVQAQEWAQRGQHQEAIQALTDAHKVEPWNAAVLFNLAMLEGLEKHPKDAILYMKRYLALDSESSNSRAAQDMIYRWEAAQR